MSRESFAIGFVKAANAAGVDAAALAGFIKSSQEVGLFSWLKNKVDGGDQDIGQSNAPNVPEQEVSPNQVADVQGSAGGETASGGGANGDGIGGWWNSLEPWQRGLASVGGGALVGGLLQKLIGGEAGATGAILGGLGGLAADGVDWNAISNAFSGGKKPAT